MKAKYLAIALPVFAAALALTVAPAMARHHHGDDDRCGRHHRDRCGGEIKVENDNDADVENNVGAISNTGLNAVVATEGDSTLETGKADAWGSAETQANANETRIAVSRYRKIKVENGNEADVDNNVGAISNTGLNMIHGCGCEDDDDDCDDDCYKPCQRDRCDGDGHHGHRGHHGHHGHHGDNGDEDEGDAYLRTGPAVSTAESMTMLNTNLTVID